MLGNHGFLICRIIQNIPLGFQIDPAYIVKFRKNRVGDGCISLLILQKYFLKKVIFLLQIACADNIMRNS